MIKSNFLFKDIFLTHLYRYYSYHTSLMLSFVRDGYPFTQFNISIKIFFKLNTFQYFFVSLNSTCNLYIVCRLLLVLFCLVCEGGGSKRYASFNSLLLIFKQVCLYYISLHSHMQIHVRVCICSIKSRKLYMYKAGSIEPNWPSFII